MHQPCDDYFSCKRVSAEETFVEFIVTLFTCWWSWVLLCSSCKTWPLLNFFCNQIFCMYIKHTLCYLLKSVLWVCLQRSSRKRWPVVVRASYTSCCYFDGVWNVFLWVLLHYLVFNTPILTVLEGHLCWCPFWRFSYVCPEVRISILKDDYSHLFYIIIVFISRCIDGKMTTIFIVPNTFICWIIFILL